MITLESKISIETLYLARQVLLKGYILDRDIAKDLFQDEIVSVSPNEFHFRDVTVFKFLNVTVSQIIDYGFPVIIDYDSIGYVVCTYKAGQFLIDIPEGECLLVSTDIFMDKVNLNECYVPLLKNDE